MNKGSRESELTGGYALTGQQDAPTQNLYGMTGPLTKTTLFSSTLIVYLIR